METIMKQILATLFVLLFIFQNLYAGTIKIPSDQPTIQVGIVSSSSGDTILVSPGTYYESINFNGKNIVLGSLFLTTGDTTYISQTVIDGNKQGCVVIFESGEDSTAVLTGFTITNGYSYLDSLRGGGITCANSSSPKLSNLIVKNNEVVGAGELYGGGGIYCLRSSSPTMVNLIVKYNTAKDCFGGGIYCRDSSNCKMLNVIVSDNSNLSKGGGIAVVRSRTKIKDSRIQKNNAKHGGGIYLESSKAEIYNLKLMNNIASNNYGAMGGGIYSINSVLRLKETDISYNSSESHSEPNSQGGGVYAVNCSIVIENCTINENNSQGSGGGICINGGKTKINTTSICYNNAFGLFSNGGGINVRNIAALNTFYLKDVLIALNNASGSGGGIFFFPDERTQPFRNVTIKTNRSLQRGGGLATNENLLISDSSECSIYLNRASEGGSDFYILVEEPSTSNEIYLDTATVSNPDDYHIYPIKKIELHYKHAIFESVDADLYVSPNGLDENSGISKDEPLKTIGLALLVASTDSINRRTIYLAPGTYSASTTGEEFPLYGRSYVSIKGERADITILDGEDESNLIELINCNSVSLEDFTVQNGHSYSAGGIFISGKDIILRDLVIQSNYAESDGGGLYVYNSNDVKLLNLTISNNISNSINSSGGISYIVSQREGTNLKLINSIVTSNIPSNIELISMPWDNGDMVLMSHCNIEGGIKEIINSDTVKIHWLDSNIDSDPLFVGGDPFDYNLSDNSLCINSGTPFLVWEGDTLINLSPEEYIGEAPDMGALESDVLISVEGKEELPTEFKLEQNFPNPFNPSTTIKYSIPVNLPTGKAGVKSEMLNVKIIVYDILGREVRTLVNKVQKAGNYEVTFDASVGRRIASGLYFYRLTTNGFTKTIKMLLLQ